MTHIYGVDKQAHDISCSTQQVLQHITNSHMHVYTLIQYTIMFTHRHSKQSIAVNSSRYSCCCVDCTIGRDFLRGLQWTRSREGGIPSGLLTVTRGGVWRVLSWQELAACPEQDQMYEPLPVTVYRSNPYGYFWMTFIGSSPINTESLCLSHYLTARTCI